MELCILMASLVGGHQPPEEFPVAAKNLLGDLNIYSIRSKAIHQTNGSASILGMMRGKGLSLNRGRKRNEGFNNPTTM